MDELTYLISETGPGNLRIDPRFLVYLTNDKEFIHFPRGNARESQAILKKKRKVEEDIRAKKNSAGVQDLLAKVLGNYIDAPRIVNRSPLIIEGSFHSVPIVCLLKNGDWIFPEDGLFEFLKTAQDQKRFPILIAKKIHGILFPVFKTLSVMGCSTYKTYLPPEIKKLIEAVKSEDVIFSGIKYHDQFQILDDDYFKISENYWDGEAMKNFFEVVLPKNIDSYYEGFLGLKIEISGSFVDTASQFRKNSPNKKLLEGFNRQQEMIYALKKTFE